MENDDDDKPLRWQRHASSHGTSVAAGRHSSHDSSSLSELDELDELLLPHESPVESAKKKRKRKESKK